jgi:ribosomal protein S18 acetylase RimI-like enzyme
VRRATPRDAPQICALWTELAEHHARLDPRHALREGAALEIRKLVAAELRDSDAVTFLSERSGSAQGFCMARIDQAPPIQREAVRAEIGEVFVRPEARRTGIGRELVRAALGWVRDRGVDRVVVRVFRDNAAGLAFWRAQGFGALMDVLERRL